jgi:hypothetical protein
VHRVVVTGERVMHVQVQIINILGPHSSHNPRCAQCMSFISIAIGSHAAGSMLNMPLVHCGRSAAKPAMHARSKCIANKQQNASPTTQRVAQLVVSPGKLSRLFC